MTQPNAEHCILQVEDDPNDVVIMDYAFKRSGFEHCRRVVTSGDEALNYLQGQGKYANRTDFPFPSIILLDLKLPRMNGFEVLRWIRSQPALRFVVVIIFSSSAHPQDLARAVELGANAYVQKPSGQEGMLNFVNGLRMFWLKLHVFPPGLTCSQPEGIPAPTLNP